VLTFITSIQAIDPRDGELKEWAGPNISAISFENAERYCQGNGLGYCKVVGLLVTVIDERTEQSTTNYDQYLN